MGTFLPTGQRQGLMAVVTPARCSGNAGEKVSRSCMEKNWNASLGLVHSLGRNIEVSGAERAGMTCRGGNGSLNTFTKLKNLCH